MSVPNPSIPEPLSPASAWGGSLQPPGSGGGGGSKSALALLSVFRREILEFLHKHHIGKGGRGFYFHFKALKEGKSKQGRLLYLRGSR